jgi:uncharacterized protein YdgA (DUF945 family)
MNKIVVAVVALVVILLLAVPPALGTLTESRVRERVTAIAGNGLITAELKSFDRGWFRSKAKIEFALTPDYLAKIGATNGPASILGQRATIAVDFVHGPVVVQNGVHLGWSTMVTRLDPETPGLAQLQQQLGVPYLFEFRSRTGLAGGVTFDADVPPMDVPAGTAQFKFSGATLDGHYAGKRAVSNTRADAVEFESPGGTFVLRNLRLSTDNEILSQDLMPGKGEFSIESISAIDPLQGSTPIFQIDNLKATGGSTLNAAQTLLDITVTYGLDRLHVAENELTGATMGFTFHNLDVATFQHYNTAMREVALSGTPPNPQDVIAQLRPDVERALAAGPSLVLDPIRFAFDGEPFEGRAEITIDPAKIPPGGITDFDPAVVLRFVNSKVDVKLSKALARRLVALAAEMQFRGDPRMPPEQLKYMAEAQAGLMLVQFVNQGFLVEDGEVYRAALRYVDGALTLNDTPLPLFAPQ